ncbi:ABC-three component system middle component 6 [uncultured Methanobrevibacter sp.]|uniref:ABC-three component system middle component 6 n=1 Tax=uncultured Methanobrevibacter sp. TaxID=253161 RepID=UPI0025D716EF|nr:ABC-three component system middle component 6 [uncultured Methanobrevibacter sp.]
MIMPNKYLKEEDTLLGSSAVIFNNLTDKQSLSELWDKVKQDDAVYNFERFILSLDMLYLLDVIDFNENNIIKV